MRVSWGMQRYYEDVDIEAQGKERRSETTIATGVSMRFVPYRGSENPEFIDQRVSTPLFRGKLAEPNSLIKRRHIIKRGNGQTYTVIDVDNILENGTTIVEQTLLLQQNPD